MSRRRQTIARNLVEAQHTAAMLTTFNEVDMTALMAPARAPQGGVQGAHGVGLGFTSFFVKAVGRRAEGLPPPQRRDPGRGDGAQALLRHRHRRRRAGGPGRAGHPRRRPSCRSPTSSSAIREFAGKAQNGTLTLDDLRGGTFTITNGGVFGSLLSTPILNPPQVGILGLHKIEERPVALKGQVVIRPMMYVALSYDHRIVDGREAVQFLVRVKELIEDPGQLLLEG